jgi:hypothetical protein
MARRCIICDKGTVTGNNRSHAENKTRRTWKPNLQEDPGDGQGQPTPRLRVYHLLEKRKGTAGDLTYLAVYCDNISESNPRRTWGYFFGSYHKEYALWRTLISMRSATAILLMPKVEPSAQGSVALKG